MQKTNNMKTKKQLTIKEFVLSQKIQGINEWIKLIEYNGFEHHSDIILKCADYYNLIEINHSANFEITLI